MTPLETQRGLLILVSVHYFRELFVRIARWGPQKLKLIAPGAEQDNFLQMLTGREETVLTAGVTDGRISLLSGTTGGANVRA